MQVANTQSMTLIEDTFGSAARPTSTPYNVWRVNLGSHYITLRQWHGSGPPLVLVHGIGSSGSTWDSLIPALRQHFSPITLDLRGHGDSGKPESGFLFDDYVNDLDGVLAALGLEHPLLVGHSFGGLVTLGWAARHPDRAMGIVLVDSPLRVGKEFLPAFKGWMILNAMPTIALTAWYRLGNPEWSFGQARRRARVMKGTARNVFVELRADSLANDGIDRMADAEGVSSPILLIHGDPESGSMVRTADAVEFDERLPNGHTINIRGAGHALHRERTDEFLSSALPFLEECAERHLFHIAPPGNLEEHMLAG
jgi:pimeloyl-ACP methyl ester carboxylesterase